ncbi:ABC transporter ATP-binding protein [Rhizobium oryziradicis]|uniref:ABC transporter ATP-binding protein n=1 Tax=Rhizobium oryziradicis TaxID=1867956 RepID=A0A1Q8ZWH6_9HYPH|nr:oligopeptide/dipeptide ABC transporter ATP-binding protein [Rhizobium oryziradicis]OLP46337.1 ABC transporter ATP-binding protein [Rhizobium oryziradicis]
MRSSHNVLEVDQLSRVFDVSAPWLSRVVERKPKRYLQAVKDISFVVEKGKCLALVGESGCGKSTVARLVTGLYEPSEGAMMFAPASRGRNRGKPMEAQMIFQDPHASLNPRWRVGDIIAEPIREFGLRKGAQAIEARVAELLQTVGLSADDANRYPHAFSGGQRQRISIARALASEPEFLVCDEPTSALDVSVQAQILNLMRKLQDELGLTYLFISHNLAVVRHMADRIAVMYLGRIVEEADTEALFSNPQHPYTQLLLQTIPDVAAPNRDRALMGGEPPSPLDPPQGCAFHPRCPIANAACSQTMPAIRARLGGGKVACHLASDVHPK